MKQILVYADSLSWGIIPHTRKRLPFDERWPGILEHELTANGKHIRILENCLNGRRTVWSDPLKAGRDGSQGLAQVMEMHAPLAMVILMLGSNDFQRTHDNNAWLSAQGMRKLIQIIRQAPIEPDMPVPEIMVIAPPAITQPTGAISRKFEGADKRCIGLPEELEKIAQLENTHYINSNRHITTSKIDGIHLDKDQHLILGKLISSEILRNNLI